MVRHKYFIAFIICIFFTVSFCKKNTQDEDWDAIFNKAKYFFEKQKYSRSKEKFNYIISENPGTSYSLESHYYLAKCLFQLKSFDEAIVEFEQYLGLSNDDKLIEETRYNICRCYYQLTLNFERDQSNTLDCIEQAQYFLEDYKGSDFSEEISSMISELRNRIAMKDLSTANLYLKMEEFESAIIYYNIVINEFYDSNVSDYAKIGIVKSYLSQNNVEKARKYLLLNEATFFDSLEYVMGNNLIDEHIKNSKKKSFMKKFKF